jgi:hypothetical protein
VFTTQAKGIPKDTGFVAASWMSGVQAVVLDFAEIDDRQSAVRKMESHVASRAGVG